MSEALSREETEAVLRAIGCGHDAVPLFWKERKWSYEGIAKEPGQDKKEVLEEGSVSFRYFGNRVLVEVAWRELVGPNIGEPGDHIYVGALREWFQRRGFWGYGHLGNLGWGAFFSSRSIAGPGAKVPNQYATEALAVVLAGRAGGGAAMNFAKNTSG